MNIKLYYIWTEGRGSNVAVSLFSSTKEEAKNKFIYFIEHHCSIFVPIEGEEHDDLLPIPKIARVLEDLSVIDIEERDISNNSSTTLHSITQEFIELYNSHYLNRYLQEHESYFLAELLRNTQSKLTKATEVANTALKELVIILNKQAQKKCL